jgi:hypothetical protein
MIRTASVCLALSLACLFTPKIAAAPLNTVAPAGFEPTSGGFPADSPFGSSTANSGGRRLQQIFDASLFASFGGPRLITEIQFRAASPENQFRPNSITTSDSTISLSTTSVTSDPGATSAGAFSASFADNIGSDVQVVHSGALTLDRGGSNATGAQPFVYGFALQTPFVYDPSMGNLLLDVIVPAGATLSFGAGFGAVESFDASVASGDGVASVRGTGGTAVGAAGQTGLITQFVTESVPVPEPGSLLMCLSAVALLGLRRFRR